MKKILSFGLMAVAGFASAAVFEFPEVKAISVGGVETIFPAVDGASVSTNGLSAAFAIVRQPGAFGQKKVLLDPNLAASFARAPEVPIQLVSRLVIGVHLVDVGLHILGLQLVSAAARSYCERLGNAWVGVEQGGPDVEEHNFCHAYSSLLGSCSHSFRGETSLDPHTVRGTLSPCESSCDNLVSRIDSGRKESRENTRFWRGFDEYGLA